MRSDRQAIVTLDWTLAAERRERLCQLFSGRTHLSIREIRDALHASLATVRRDLMALEAQGIVSRVHGGAVACQDAWPAPNVENQPDSPHQAASPEPAAGTRTAHHPPATGSP